jgi:hypothetical protein
MISFSTFIFTATGAFFVWAVKGFKGPFNHEMVSIDQRNSTKGILRFLLGLGFWIIILVVVAEILSSPDEVKGYRVKTNDKGEIIEIEETK